MLYSETKRRALTLIGVPSAKVKMINVRLAPAVHDAFKIACELRGASMSSLLHQFIVRTIREEKETDPRAFREEPKKLPATTLKLPRTTEKRKTG